jgi:hypothetical protein
MTKISLGYAYRTKLASGRGDVNLRIAEFLLDNLTTQPFVSSGALQRNDTELVSYTATVP